MNVVAASGQLQWGHGDEAVEDGIDRIVCHAERSRFNGATAMMPWKSRCGYLAQMAAMTVAYPWSSIGFNGATAMKPWKTPRRRCRRCATRDASMGPRR